MVHIKVTKGLDIPIKGHPNGAVKSTPKPRSVSLNLAPFEDTKFHLLAKTGDTVTIGQPIAEDKSQPGRLFVSPGHGVIREIRRGYKRRLLDIVIDIQEQEEYFEHPKINLNGASREELVTALGRAGLFTRIMRRPCPTLVNPHQEPRAIFVKALESAPFLPPAELQVKGRETELQLGLDALKKLCAGPVHLVYRKGSECHAFTQAKNVITHTVEGPHPAANASLHIQAIDPIQSLSSLVWVLDVATVVAIGHFLSTGRTSIERIISIAGPGVLPGHTGYFLAREGYPINPLIEGRLSGHSSPRLISGDPLMGTKVEAPDFLGFNHYALTVVPESTTREFLHFFRAGTDKYSFSRAYLSGHFDTTKRLYDFTTSQHGEHRAFVDSSLYDQVQPLSIPTMLLVKAVMAEDFDLAEELGLLQVDSEDFALPTFVCPSKMEMTEIMKSGLRQHTAQMLA